VRSIINIFKAICLISVLAVILSGCSTYTYDIEDYERFLGDNQTEPKHTEPIETIASTEKATEKETVKPRTEYPPYSGTGQVRNNKIDVYDGDIVYVFWEDATYREFENTGLLYDDYIKGLLDTAESMGIDRELLSRNIENKRYKGENKISYPVVIETGEYEGKECFIIVYTWEMAGLARNKDGIVKPLGHIYVYALEAESGEVIGFESCW